MDRGETLANFIAVTGADDTVALSLLEATEWRLEEAINMFLEGDFAEHGTQPGGNAVGSSVYEEEEEVRAPIPATQGVLCEDDIQPAAAYYRRQAPVQRHIVDAFRDIREEGASAGEGARAEPENHERGYVRRQQPAGLSALFKPPVDLVYGGTLMQARKDGLEQKRWLLVNVQDDKEFASHQLNRDVWVHAPLKALIRDSFLFIQMYKELDEGTLYLQYYPSGEVPCIDIIDPRTAERVLHLGGFVDAADLIIHLRDFLQRNSLDDMAARPRSTSAVDEDAQLDEALRISRVEAEAEERERKRSGVPAEPGAGADPSSVSRIVVRLPDGARLQRRFLSSDSLQAVVDFIECSTDVNMSKFEVATSHPRKVYSDLSQTLQASGLHPQAMLFLKEK